MFEARFVKVIVFLFVAAMLSSSAAGILAIIVALVSTPSVWAWVTASFTPSQRPKSSAFIMIRFSIRNKSKRHRQFGQSDSVRAVQLHCRVS